MPSRRKATDNLTLDQNKKICLWNEENAAFTKLQLAARAMREFNLVKALVQGTISGILRDRKTYLLVKEAEPKCKRTRQLVFLAANEELAKWVLNCQSKHVMLSGDLIKAKSKRFATLSGVQNDQLLSFSNGWLQTYERTRREWLGEYWGKTCAA
uniref:AlNc14C60G4396 protein n=1 Tax=Albugo laibachii Nc14 TaxID=890382 RepID=F0WCR8_9STRA|nr:AlNc14C60G4396 [Albugo laibachii Nc14]|eukprot:CCA18933.1 AlNc14C60G4396 [Albugo laibachii Nc14]